MVARLRLRGRVEEMAALRLALAEASSGRSSIVVVEGEPGIGKSRLLAESGEAARHRGMQVAAGRAEELEQSRPFGVLARIFGCEPAAADPRRAKIAELLVPHERGGENPITVSADPGLQHRAIDAIADFVEELTLAGPMLIGVDDLQWADPSSLLTLAAIAARSRYLPVALVVGVRPLPRSRELDRVLAHLLDESRTRHITMRGLDPDAVTAMVEEATAGPPGPTLLAAVAGAAGNPLFVSELLDALDEEGALHIVDGRSEAATAVLSPTLRLTILRRLSFLPEETLAMLRAAAILGSGFTLRDVSVTMQRPAIDLSAALVEALRGHVLAEDGDRLRFRHDLIRDAIYEDLPLTVRRGLHIEAGQRLATAGAPVLQVAEQWSRGAIRGDADAVRWLFRAAREAAGRSPAVAATLLTRALELMLPTDESADQVRLELATSQMLSGRLDEAAAISRSLMKQGRSPAVQANARLCLAHTLLASGRPSDALVQLRRVAVTDGLPDAHRAGVAAWSGLASVFVGDFDTADHMGDSADDLARTSGDAVARSIAMTVQACVRQARGELSEALRIADEALRLADASPDRAGHRYPLHIGRGSFLIDLDRVAEARSALDEARRVGEELGTRWPEASESNLRGVALFIAGEWDDAVAELEAGAELARESGENLSMIRAHATTALIRLHRNDLDGAQQIAALATRDLERIPHSPMAPWAALADALVREAQGNGEAALASLTRSWEGWRAGRMISEFPTVGPDLVRLARAAGEPELARRVSADVERLADHNQVPSAAAMRCSGLADDHPELLERAAIAYETIPRPLERALTAEDAGTSYLRQAEPARARPLLERAAASYEKIGAVRDLLRTEATLRSVGVHRGRRGARKRPQHGWASLTPTELTIAGLVFGLVAQGLSNPQIANRLYVSRRTVQTHLSHMFSKLEITSRVHLVNKVMLHAG